MGQSSRGTVNLAAAVVGIGGTGGTTTTTMMVSDSGGVSDTDGVDGVSGGVGSFYWWCQSGRTLTTLAVQAGIFSVLVIAVDRWVDLGRLS